MVRKEFPPKIGIIGGGQLGRMLIYRAKKLGFAFSVLDEDERGPAAPLADTFIRGGLKNTAALRDLVLSCDVATYEIEHIDTRVLEELEAAGNLILPTPKTLTIIQDKLKQKKLFREAGISVSGYFSSDDPRNEEIDAAAFPLVQKARREGYDGRGVLVLRSAKDERLPVPSLFEDLVDIDKELAVMVARGRDGKVASHPVVEMAFDPDHNICDMVVVPARVSSETADRARRIAVKAVEALEGVGIFGVELFLTRAGDILLNEVAPRPHNSGHYTMEACETCQFEQHARAITGLPLGSTRLLSPAVMVNILGLPGSTGRPQVFGIAEALSISGVSVHLYGKSEVRAVRKMGHFTALGNTLEEAWEKAEKVRGVLKIGGLP